MVLRGAHGPNSARLLVRDMRGLYLLLIQRPKYRQAPGKLTSRNTHDRRSAADTGRVQNTRLETTSACTRSQKFAAGDIECQRAPIDSLCFDHPILGKDRPVGGSDLDQFGP